MEKYIIFIMENEEILSTLKKWNFWEKDIGTGIRREYYIKKIFTLMDRKEILVLKGIRRCGKSTIARQLMLELLKKGVEKKQILYLNLEDYSFANSLNIGLFDKVLEAYKRYLKNSKKTYFFIDEIQKIESWEKWIRTKYDLEENIKFIVTGSSASLLSKEFSSLLTGRNLSLTIFPLSFKEFSLFSHKADLEEYLIFGGFPEVVLEKSEEKKRTLLQQYFEDIVHKDIIDRHNIRNAKQVLDLARYLISTSGSKVSINKLSKVFGVAKDTISLYLGYMIEAFLLFEVTYFSYSAKVKHDVSKLPKIYSLDSGFINITNFKYVKERGRMFENTVLLKLLEKYKEISYWSELNSEVDFIAEKIAINVTSTDKIPAREFKGLEDFNKKFRKFDSFVISDSLKKGNIIPIREFLQQ